MFSILWRSCSAARCKKGQETELNWIRTSHYSLKKDVQEKECLYILVRKCLSPSPPTLLHIFWSRELWLKHITAPHSGWAPNKWWGGGDTEWGTRGEPLKKACQNNENKWRRSLGRLRELHLWGVFNRILLHRSKSSIYRDRGEYLPCTDEGKLKRRKMRTLIVIIVQGQLFPLRSNSHWCALECNGPAQWSFVLIWSHGDMCAKSNSMPRSSRTLKGFKCRV